MPDDHRSRHAVRALLPAGLVLLSAAGSAPTVNIPDPLPGLWRDTGSGDRFDASGVRQKHLLSDNGPIPPRTFCMSAADVRKLNDYAIPGCNAQTRYPGNNTVSITLVCPTMTLHADTRVTPTHIHIARTDVGRDGARVVSEHDLVRLGDCPVGAQSRRR